MFLFPDVQSSNIYNGQMGRTTVIAHASGEDSLNIKVKNGNYKGKKTYVFCLFLQRIASWCLNELKYYVFSPPFPVNSMLTLVNIRVDYLQWLCKCIYQFSNV